ncbi:unnamed protein product [Staurois parvus]|uniref:Uncharacterized protein n=1 Tax=Staurois parvus TaxID=386267 RepID=A0ABN9E011_9NEOB|nr:unnamed protein product [Staurois parvus]
MYINGRTGAVQGRVAVYKRPPCLCASSLVARSTTIRCPLCPEDTAEHQSYRTSV